MSGWKRKGAGYGPSAFITSSVQKYTTWADLGIDIPATSRGETRAMCPKCSPGHRSRSRTLSANVDAGLFQCFRCGFRGRVGGGEMRAVVPLAPYRRERDMERRVCAIKAVLAGCVPLSHPSAETGRRYLRSRLGVELVALPKLGFHPSLAYFESDDNGRRVGAFPAIVATVRDANGRLVTLHRTYLAPDGLDKARVESSPKKLMSPPYGTVTGSAVRLYEPTDELVIAEGVETALALAYALMMPAWACVSAHGLATVDLPATIRSVTIGADNDRSGAGQNAALAARRKLEAEGRQVRVIFPKRQGQDWLDVLREERT